MPKRTKKKGDVGKDGFEMPAPQQPQPPPSEEAAIRLEGRSGEGADSALARLIEQEQARGDQRDVD